MCGRFDFEFTDNFYSRYDIAERNLNLEEYTSYNIPPGTIRPVVVSHSPKSVELMLWGLVPWYEEKKDKPRLLANVRDDSIINKGWANKYIEFQRCIVPASGFFEWKKTEEGKVPYRFKVKDEEYFSIAGMYSTYKRPKDDKEVTTFTLITTTPNELMEPVHNRMPVILRKDEEEDWLNSDNSEKEQMIKFLKPYPSKLMEKYPVSTMVNSPVNNRKEVLEPEYHPDPELTLFGANSK